MEGLLRSATTATTEKANANNTQRWMYNCTSSWRKWYNSCCSCGCNWTAVSTFYQFYRQVHAVSNEPFIITVCPQLVRQRPQPQQLRSLTSRRQTRVRKSVVMAMGSMIELKSIRQLTMYLSHILQISAALPIPCRRRGKSHHEALQTLPRIKINPNLPY